MRKRRGQREGVGAVELRLGLPLACPRCGGSGYVDAISLRTHSSRHHCRQCGYAWRLEEDDVGRVHLVGSAGIEPATKRL